MFYARRPAPSCFHFLLIPAVLSVVGIHSACLVRAVKPPPQPVIRHSATLEELLGRLERFGRIETTRLNVRLQVSFVTEDRKTIEEYPESSGLILTQRPGSIRVRAEAPVVGTTVFDMTSDGETFQVHLPTKKRFLRGRNAFDKPSDKRVENLRPQHILNALLIRPPQKAENMRSLRNTSYGGRAYHVVMLHSVTAGTPARELREIWFDRSDLHIARQLIFDRHAEVETDAWYRQWSEHEGAPIPGTVRIDRPRDGYKLTVRLLKASINQPLPKASFILEAPPGAKVEEIGQTPPEEDSGRSPS